jgi:hypothetical protein
VAIAGSAALLVGMFANAPVASAAPGAGGAAAMPLGAPVANTSRRPGPLTGLGPVSPGADGTNRPATTGSPADTPIAPLPAIDPGPNDAPSVPKAVVPQTLPVSPAPIVLPTQPGQTLVDATAQDALNTMSAEGPYTSGGAPALDANKLQPQMPSAQFGDPTNPATLQQTIAALLSGNFPPPLPIDPLALLQQLPNGIPQITYRVCSESATKPASCSITLPLGVPAMVNVTGNGTAASPDRTPDVFADLVPAVGVTTIVTASQTLLTDQTALNAAQKSLTDLVNLLLDPVYLLTHPLALVQKLNLQNLIAALTTQVKNDLLALTSLVNVGLGFMQIRMGTSEIPGDQPLKAHIWAVYDIPGYHRLSIGFDGYRRGAGLARNSLGIYTFNPAAIARGVYDVQADLISSTGDSMSITAGISSITQDSAGTAYDPTVASIKFSPIPTAFSAHAVIDPGTEQDSVQTTTNLRTQLDAVIFSNRHHDSPPSDQYTQLKIDTLPNTVTATLRRPSNGGATTVSYRASQTIDQVLFANYQYAGATLQHALQANAYAVPASIDISLLSSGDSTTATYTASSSLATLGLAYYEQSMALSGTTGPLVLRGALTGLPTNVTLLIDSAAKHVKMTADQPLGAVAVQASYKLGKYSPLAGDHATYIADGKAFGADARISGLKSVDVYYDQHPRVTLAFSPGGQSFSAAGIIDGHTKFRGDISNLPANLSIDLDTAGRKFAYTASSVIDRISAAYVDTTTGPSIAARIDKVPTNMTASWDLGSAPHVHYTASSVIPDVQFFASLQGVETVDPHGNDYLSADITDIPATLDLVADFPNSHIEGNSSSAIGSITVAARAPFAGREWQAVGQLVNIPARFTADFGNGNFDFHALSGPLGQAALTVSNHGDPSEPTSPAHLAVHYNQLTGDLDASASIINLTEVGYTSASGNQQLVLQADEGSNPLQIDADLLLTPDVSLRAFGAITGLPSNVNITFGNGKITYTADKHVGIQLGLRVGKVAALAGLGAPLPANGIAAVARSCDAGPNCSTDAGPFCSAFPKCLGAVANINMSGLPTSVVVDTVAGTIGFTGYQPPSSTLSIYLRLIGLITALPDVSAKLALSGLPASLDFTAGPFTFGTGNTVDASYSASAPLGTLTADVNATTTNATFPVLRANATIAQLPKSMHVHGSFGSINRITVTDSAATPSISAKVTSATSGYLQASITNVPATMDYLVDVPNSHAEATMSSAIDDITVIAHVPYNGRTWNAFAQATTIPGHFTADFGGGSFGFHALSGPLGSATFAVSNFVGATVPDTTDYLAAHYDELSGNIDAGAKVVSLTTVAYGDDAAGNQTFDLDMGAATVGLDADVVLKANGARDTRYAAGGTITTPNTVHVDISNGHIVYHSDQSAALRLSAAVGKVAALAGLAAPLYTQGVAVRARACASGPGCASDTSIFCSVFSSCWGAVANVNLPGLPTKVDIDTKAGTVNLVGLHPTGELKVFAQLNNLISGLPQVRALATISGLPSVLDLNVGPFGADPADPTKFRAGYSASQNLGHLQIDADADTTISGLGTVRGQFIASNLPKTVSVTGQFGSQNHIDVVDSGPISDLRVQATATLTGTPGSALIDFTDIPSVMHLDVGSAGSGDGVNAPDFTYKACTDNSNPCTSPVSTLDGLVQVDAQLSQNVGPASVGTNGAFFRFTNLGADTLVRLNTSNYHLDVTSDPGTDSFQAGLNIQVGDIANKNFDEIVLSKLDTDVHVEGHYGIRPSHIGDIELDIEGLRSMTLQPGDAPFGLPALAGLLFPGVTGDYGTFSMNLFDVDINPDVYVKVWADAPGPINPTLGDYTFPSHIDSFVFHRYDMNGHGIIGRVDVAGVVCFDLTQQPRPTGKFVNGVTLSGSDGPQTFNFIDYNDDIPDILVNVAAAFMSPFGHDFDVDVNGC